MISQADSPSNAWTPGGFEQMLELYPATPVIAVPDTLQRTSQFVHLWNESDSRDVKDETAIVLTPGLFAEWLPQCFAAARQYFRNAGYRVLRSRVRSSHGVFDQSKLISQQLQSWLGNDETFVWCGHSKGGLELLRALEQSPQLRARCRAAIVVQPPVGVSRVLARFSSEQATFSQRISNQLLRTKMFSAGVRDISDARDPALTRWLSSFAPSVPTLNVVSWSIEPTSWIDSWHKVLGEACPGIAHDGQFLTHQQLLPKTPVVMLPRIDHAQPVLGGNGFDAARFWQTLVRLAINPITRPQTR